jgi:hypothetical protein
MAIKSRRSREGFYRELLIEQAGSGLSLRSFAESKGIKPATFYVWSRRLRIRERAVSSGPAMLPVHVLPRPPSRGCFEVTLVSGRELRVPSGFDEGELARLVAVLERC